jgi:hypothetical protein
MTKNLHSTGLFHHHSAHFAVLKALQSANQPKYQNTYQFLVNRLDFAASCSLYSTSHG